MTRSTQTLGPACFLAALLLTTAAARAQYSPDASASLGAGYGSIALGSSIMSGTRALGHHSKQSDQLSPTMRNYCAQWPNEGVCRADRARNKAQVPAKAVPVDPKTASDIDAARERARQKLFSEYKLRLTRDGKNSADQWLKKAAFEAGRQAGLEARKQQQR